MSKKTKYRLTPCTDAEVEAVATATGRAMMEYGIKRLMVEIVFEGEKGMIKFQADPIEPEVKG